MEQNKLQLTTDKLPLIDEAFASIESMEKFCNKILESRLAPDHFYPKIPGTSDRDYTKGNTAAVMMVLIQGNQLHLPVLTSLQQIVPVNGLLSIKGDGAKAMIISSGKVQPGSWKEEETGSIEKGDYIVIISAERSDTHEKLSRSFSVERAKRAGLWVTEQMLSAEKGWKWKQSAWYKFPERMIKYRALGFLARDLFPDVMSGAYITEEARDIPQETAEVIETPSGATITIPDKEHNKKRSEKLTTRVIEAIKPEIYGPASTTEDPIVKESTVDEVLSEKINETILQPVVINESKPEEQLKPDDKDHLSLEIMEHMETSKLLEIINGDMDMMEAMEMIPGKNTNKKLREIIYAHQGNILAEYVAKFLDKETGGIQPNKEQGTPIVKNQDILEPIKTVVNTGNKYNFEIPEFDSGNTRDFSTMKIVFNKMLMIDPPVNNPRWLELARKLGLTAKYKNREEFCKNATVAEINALLDEN